MVKIRRYMPVLLTALFMGCTKKQSGDFLDTFNPDSLSVSSDALHVDISEGRELFCLADSFEEAISVADLYSIELVDFSQSVATFHTKEDPFLVVKRGRDNNWHSLEVNHVIKTNDPVMEKDIW